MEMEVREMDVLGIYAIRKAHKSFARSVFTFPLGIELHYEVVLLRLFLRGLEGLIMINLRAYIRFIVTHFLFLLLSFTCPLVLVTRFVFISFFMGLDK